MSTEPRLTIAVTYCSTDKAGFVEREDYVVQACYEQPLLPALLEVLPANLQQALQQGTLECYEGHEKGKSVDVHTPPLSVPFLMESLHHDRNPVLFLTYGKEDQEEDQGRSSDMLRRQTGSELIREMLKQTGTGSEQEEEAAPVSPPVRNHFSMSFEDMSTAEDDLILLNPLNEEDVEEGSDNANSSEEDSIDGEELLNKSCPQGKAKTLGGRYRPCRSDTGFPATGGRVMRSTTTYGGVLKDSKIEPIRRRSTSIARMNAFRRSKLGSRISMEIFPSTQITVEIEEEGWNFATEYHANMTVGEFRAAITRELNNKWQSRAELAKPFTLLYSHEGEKFELYNHSQFLHYTYFHQRPDPPPILKVMVNFAAAAPDYRDLVILYRISRLTKVILDKRVFSQGDVPQYMLIAAPDMAEVTLARRTLQDFVSKVTSERDTLEYSISPELCSRGAPTIVSFMIPTSNRIPVNFHYKDIFSLTRSVHINKTANSVLDDVMSCLKACELLEEDDDGSYVLQLTGEYSYIHGNHELIAFKDIRDCIAKKEAIHLSVVPCPCQDLYRACKFDRPKMDPYTLYTPLHSDLVLRSATRSVWNIKDKLKVRICRVENLKFDHAELLSVEVSLHFGCKTLHKCVSTSCKLHVAFNAAWNEILEFDFQLCDIPKEAKLLLILRDSASLSYHWGLYSLYDFESSKLRSGDHSVLLWEVDRSHLRMSRVPKTSLKRPMVEQEEEKFMSILAGPPANNPSHSAVRVVMGLETTPTQHIIHPSTSADSTEDYFQENKKARHAQLHKHFKTHLNLEFRASNWNREPFCDLHKHLSLVHWNILAERLEAWELLNNLKQHAHKIPIYVALKLLDSDFPDENVRRFAVRVLERLANEDLQDYLLQLVQALKFESHHDSALARFLLGRALQNKNIGHFFFWYLLCEMQSSQYVPRIATLLEAYLIGCGEALMTRFKDELEIQDVLQRLGKEMKDAYGKDSAAMQDALPGALRKSELHKIAFFPISNPRLAVGRLRANKCKILSSAKRPIWLELLNVTRTILNPSPIRLIFKMGDDLRQDTITLRVLSLFDKLWKNEGLDLKLIPYGCMATGYKTGFIQVVKNAKTIAEVSGVRENKKLYQWIQSHQMNEFGEVDDEKMADAVNTFIHSCAGYSVATYALGIGDRHNDNIMVTTSGNLFHIDFGHFLGHIKHFMGFKREWAPFVLTPDFIYVMGGEKSKSFELYRNLCCRAFLILRRHADLIIHLFSIMRSTGIPELTCVEDTDYIRNALVLDKNDREAEKCFQDVIKKCLDLGWTVQVMWYFHKMRHSSD